MCDDPLEKRGLGITAFALFPKWQCEYGVRLTYEDDTRYMKKYLEHQSKKYSWEFRFLAANQDAVLTGAEMGLARQSCETIEASEEGIQMSVRRMAAVCGGALREQARACRRARKLK
jgi:uncharacterized protein YegP (UPF0339 family)